MSLPTCTFVKANGVICKGLAVKSKDRCHFHQVDAQIVANIQDAITKGVDQANRAEFIEHDELKSKWAQRLTVVDRKPRWPSDI